MSFSSHSNALHHTNFNHFKQNWIFSEEKKLRPWNKRTLLRSHENLNVKYTLGTLHMYSALPIQLTGIMTISYELHHQQLLSEFILQIAQSLYSQTQNIHISFLRCYNIWKQSCKSPCNSFARFSYSCPQHKNHFFRHRGCHLHFELIKMLFAITLYFINRSLITLSFRW